MVRNYLFVCGCPRSGTTALWRILVGDSRIRLGVERYGNRFFSGHFLTPDLFEKERFFNIEKGDTFYSDLVSFNEYYAKADAGFDEAIYVGDKIPMLYRYFDKLELNFLGCKTIFIFRNIFDVAASYKKRLVDANNDWTRDVSDAVSDWNASLNAAREYTGDIALIDYDRLMIEGHGLDNIYSFLGLEITSEVRAACKNVLRHSGALEASRSRSLTALEVKEICQKADFNTYRDLLDKQVP